MIQKIRLKHVRNIVTTQQDLSSVVLNSLIANKQRGGRRGTSKRRAQRRNNGPITAGSGNYTNIPTLGINRSMPIGFPDQLIGKLRYHDAEPLTISGGAIQKYVYRWNSMFDPDFTGVGHQPLFRDTFAAIYDHYAVISAVAKVKFINTAAVPFYVGAVIEDDSTSSTLLDTLCEQTHGWHTLLPPVTGSLSSVTVTIPWSCKKILNIDPYTDELYKTSVGSNPTEESYLSVWALSNDGSATTVYFDVEFVYTVLWTELATPTQS